MGVDAEGDCDWTVPPLPPPPHPMNITSTARRTIARDKGLIGVPSSQTFEWSTSGQASACFTGTKETCTRLLFSWSFEWIPPIGREVDVALLKGQEKHPSRERAEAFSFPVPREITHARKGRKAVCIQYTQYPSFLIVNIPMRDVKRHGLQNKPLLAGR